MQISTKSLIKKLDHSSIKALEAAINLAVTRKTSEVSVAHFLCKVAEDSNSLFCALLQKADIKPEDFIRAISPSAYDLRGTHKGVPSLSTALTTLIHDGWSLASVDYQSQEINSGHICICFLSNTSGFYINSLTQALLKNVDIEMLKSTLHDLIKERDEKKVSGMELPADGLGADENNTLRKFTVDLVAEAAQGKIDRAIGRGKELNQIMDILCRRKQSNPVLVGEAGTGKTSVVLELAHRILAKQVPDLLQNASLRSLDVAALHAGASVQGEFESRIKDLLSAIEKSEKKIILFVDEIHNFLGASGKGADAANLLKPALAGGLSVIGATTWAEYKKFFEKDAALSRRFQLVKVLEPDEEHTVDIMRGVAQLLEKHHSVHITDKAIINSVNLSARYLTHLRLPDKAVSLLDSSCARVKIQNSLPPLSLRQLQEKINIKKHLKKRIEKDFFATDVSVQSIEDEINSMQKEFDDAAKRWQEQIEIVSEMMLARKNKDKEAYLIQSQVLQNAQKESDTISECVDEHVVADVLTNWTGIPVSSKGQEQELINVLTLDDKIAERVIGQQHAVERIVDSIRISKANMSDARKPIGVFLLVGESGVGKTETALSIAEVIYGHESRIITINMSEYKEGHKVASLIGAPPGYVGYGEGGRLTEQVRRNPYSVILLDEIEKAHPNVQELFLQVFDKGTLADSEGVVVDFKNTVIILTSNLGAKTVRDFCLGKYEEHRKRKQKQEENEQNASLDSEDSVDNAVGDGGARAAQFEEEKDLKNGEENEQDDTQQQDQKCDNTQEDGKNDEVNEKGQDEEEGQEEEPEEEKEHVIQDSDIKKLTETVHTELLKHLKPEFIGRLVVVPYLSLTHETLRGIIRIHLKRIEKRLNDNHEADLTYDDSVVEKILADCAISPMGARQIEHIISEKIMPDLAIAILDIKSQGMRFGQVNLSVRFGHFLIEMKKVTKDQKINVENIQSSG